MRLLGAAVAAAVVALLGGVAPLLGASATRPAVPDRACAAPTPGDHRLAVEEGRVPVVLHVPPGRRSGAPLVLGLPGAGQTASGFAAYTGYSTLADRGGFSVAYPTASGTRPFWNVSGARPGKPDDVAYLRAVIPAVVRAACADPLRVGVTGVSNGGGMSARMACDASDLIAAAAPVAGGYGSLPDCHPARPVPMLEVHGLDDRTVPYGGRPPEGSGAVAAFLSQWRRLDGCPDPARRRRPMANVVELRWDGCAGGAVVVHDRIIDAEHGWPGEDDLAGRRAFSTTRRTWTFLSAFSR